MSNINYRATKFQGQPVVTLNVEGEQKQYSAQFFKDWEADAAIEMLQTLEEAVDANEKIMLTCDEKKVLIEVGDDKKSYMFEFNEDNAAEAYRLAGTFIRLAKSPVAA